VKKLKIGKTEISSKTSATVLVFFAIVIFFIILGTLLLTLDGVDPETSIAVIASVTNNVGLSFRAAGPTNSFAFLSNSSKILSTFLMLLGRLEFFALLLLLVPSFWRAEK
jgi:trk system potassium uptake protein TrkH